MAQGLTFFRDIQINSYYKDYKQRIELDYGEMLDLLSAVTSPNGFPNLVVNTNISDQHILILDCDNEEDMLAAARYLYIWRIGYCLISSSPSHYWFITDYVESFEKVTAKIKMIPGVDKLYIRYNDNRGYLSLRAVPKNATTPVFPIEHSLKNPIAVKWLELFQNHFETTIQSVYETIQLKQVYENGKILEAAHNPTFKI